MGVEISDDTN